MELRMDVCTVIKMRLQELGLEQKDLAAADPEEATAGTGPDGELATLARAQRMDALRRDYEEPQGALLKETRELILQKCLPARQQQIRTIFERQPFGELEQLVTQTLLDVISRVTRVELDNEDWLRAGPHRGKEAKGALVT
jgi:hypothetical protein